MDATATSVLTIVCAWCGKELGRKSGHGSSGITHGICPACLARHFVQSNTKNTTKNTRRISSAEKS